MNSSNQLPETPGAPAPKSRLPLWMALAGLAALALAGLLRSRPAPEANTAPASVASSEPTAQVRLGANGELSTSSRNPLSSSYAEPMLLVFVPDDSGALVKRTLPPRGDIPKDARAAREKLATQAVQALLQAAPDLFPANAALSGVTVADGAPTLNFSGGFSDAGFWQGSARTTAALDALALTVDATKKQIPDAAGGSEADGVRIAVDGKPLGSLGEMDLREPYTASSEAPAGGAP